MTTAAPFGRLLTAMATAFHDDGSVDLDGTAKIAQHLVDNGNDGVVVSGTTGESPTTTVAEDGQILQAVVDAVGDRAHVIAGVGTNATAHSVELAEQAAKIGVDALLLVTPYYNKPSPAGVLHHFRSVAEATDLPVMLYDVPGRTGLPIALETYERARELANVTSVKEATGDPAHTVALTQLGYSVYCGDDAADAGLPRVRRRRARQRRRARRRARAEGDDRGLRRRRHRRGPRDPHPARAGLRRRHGRRQLRSNNRQGSPGAARRDRQPERARSARSSRRRRGHRAPRRARRVGPYLRSPLSHPHPELSTPAPLVEGGLRVIPLGGLGEVGRNMTVFEYDDRLLIVDCGVLFPEDNHPGVDLILPDFDPIRDRLDKVEALVLTHGHEDHIGATPYLLRERGDIPLVGSELTLALLGSKLREHRLKETVHHVVAEGETITFGPFVLEFIAVNHSIPDALAVVIRTGAGVVLHTGDFKMDQLPLDGRITDLNEFARLGDEGVDLFMTDSTNAEVPGFTTSEKDIAPGPRPGLRQVDPAHHRGLLRLAHPPRAAGHRRRRRPQPQGRLRRPLDGAQHGDRQGARLPPRAGRRARRRQGAGRPAGRPPGPDLDRLPGRAAQRAEPDRPAHATPSCTSRRATRSSWPAR